MFYKAPPLLNIRWKLKYSFYFSKLYTPKETETYVQICVYKICEHFGLDYIGN